MKRIIIAIVALTLTGSMTAKDKNITYEIWELNQAPNRGVNHKVKRARGFPYDKDWENSSYCIGNGYTGANLFGRVDTERIQITEKAFHNEGCYKNGGLTSLADLFIDMNHGAVEHYRRSLNLNDAIAHVTYQNDGVKHAREYFMGIGVRIGVR